MPWPDSLAACELHVSLELCPFNSRSHDSRLHRVPQAHTGAHAQRRHGAPRHRLGGQPPAARRRAGRPGSRRAGSGRRPRGGRAAPALATPAAGAAAKALARLPEPAALRFLRQMRPGAAEAALAALQARAPEGASAAAGLPNITKALLPMWVVELSWGRVGTRMQGRAAYAHANARDVHEVSSAR